MARCRSLARLQCFGRKAPALSELLLIEVGGGHDELVDTENPIRPLDACTYETYSLILLADFAIPDFVILLLVYGSLPFSPYPCTLILCASCGTNGGPCPCPSPKCHSIPKCLTLVSCNPARRRYIPFPKLLKLKVNEFWRWTGREMCEGAGQNGVGRVLSAEKHTPK